MIESFAKALTLSLACKKSSVADAKPEALTDNASPDEAAKPADVKAKVPKSTKKTPAKPKITQEEKPKKDKVPRGKNAFMHFVSAKRAKVTGRWPFISGILWRRSSRDLLAFLKIARLSNNSPSPGAWLFLRSGSHGPVCRVAIPAICLVKPSQICQSLCVCISCKSRLWCSAV